MLKTVLITGALSAIVGAYSAWYIQDLRWTRTEALYRASAASELAQATSTARAAENAAQGRIDALAVQYQTQKEELNAKNAKPLAGARSGSVQYSIPAVPSPSSAASTPSGTDAPSRCTISTDAAAALTALAVEADEQALKLNALQDYVRGLFVGVQHGTLPE